MIRRELQVLILGDVPEVEDIFDRPKFDEDLPATGLHVPDPDRFHEALEAPETYELIVVNLAPHGLEVLREVRSFRPACPVVAMVEPDDREMLLEAKRANLAESVVRTGPRDLTIDLLAESIRIALERFVEPPKMEQPSADQMHRYGHFYNILHPFFLVSTRRYLLYINRAGRELVDTLHDYKPAVSDDVDEWYLEPTPEAFHRQLDRAFSGDRLVTRRELPDDEGNELHELYYQPVVEPGGRVVAVSIAVHEPGRPQLQRARTMQAVTNFAGGVAHQINNLLGIVSTNVELLDQQLDAPEGSTRRQRIDRMQSGIDRAAHLTRQMQDYSRTSVTRREELSVDRVIDGMRDDLEEAAGDSADLHLELASDGLTVRSDREQFETVVSNLVDNAVEASPEGAPVWVRTYNERVRDWRAEPGVGQGTYVILEVEDRGEGIDQEHRDEVFEPFYTSRSSDEHVGLGLATVRTVVEHAGGGIELESTPGEGTLIRLYTPGEPSHPDAESREDAGEATPSEPTILLVEDEPDLRESCREILELEDYRVLAAESMAEAGRAARDSDEPIDLLVTDIRLPDGRGTDLAADLVAEFGERPIVLVSGYGDLPAEHLDEIEGAPATFLAKPFRVEALLTTVADLLAAEYSS